PPPPTGATLWGGGGGGLAPPPALLLWSLRLFFHLLYGPFAWAYDAVAWAVSRGKWTEWGATALPFLPRGLVLELAHGPGHLLLRMARQGLRPVGLDLSPQMGALAYRRLHRAGLPPRMVRARAQQIPFADRIFQAVVATFPTEFILDPATAREVARVLAPQGTFVFVLTAIPGGRSFLSCALRLLYRITGQNRVLPDETLQVWRDFGFSLSVHWQPVNSDAVLIVRGTRQ
ncbi:MAG: class I SAM-dependent methyltransferase, partial [Anaerolineae bacterium]|nr:class I SAM-dependent methyltransferase [Anaerolineae bacterium]